MQRFAQLAVLGRLGNPKTSLTWWHFGQRRRPRDHRTRSPGQWRDHQKTACALLKEKSQEPQSGRLRGVRPGACGE